MGNDTGARERDLQLQKRRAALVGVKEEVNEMCVTRSVENKIDVAGRNPQLSGLSPKSERTEPAPHSSQSDWKDCSIIDREEESSPAVEGLQENLNDQFLPYTASSGEEDDRAREKEPLQQDTCQLQTPDLQCTFIQIDGTVTTSIPRSPAVVCNICGKRLLSEQRLRVHIKTHASLRPYTCSQCGKSFTRKATLNFHQNIHRGVKPYTCNICPKSFADPSALRRHKSIHKGVG